MADVNKGDSWRSHIRLFIACGIVILSPFQYGFDFGMIGGLQAMKGFLAVTTSPNTLQIHQILTPTAGLWLPLPQVTNRLEHQHRAPATHLLPYDPRRLHQLRHRRRPIRALRTPVLSRLRMYSLLHRQHHHDDD
jgi:hypothetical protein